MRRGPDRREDTRRRPSHPGELVDRFDDGAGVAVNGLGHPRSDGLAVAAISPGRYGEWRLGVDYRRSWLNRAF